MSRKGDFSRHSFLFDKKTKKGTVFVDLRFRRFAFRAAESLSLLVTSSCGVSPGTLIPQDIDFASLKQAHARRKCVSIFEESSRLPLQST
jgi:hypothetical protein